MTRLPGAACTLLRDLLRAPRRAAVVGVHPTCVYLRLGDDVIAVEATDGVGLPGAVRLAVPASSGVFAAVRVGVPAQVSAGALALGPLTVEVVRWWAPRRPRPGLDAAAVRALRAALGDRPPPVPDSPDLTDLAALVGLGPGLTPAGDDVLAGLLVGLHHDAARRDALVDEVLPRLGRTTALSAALLRHAMLGHGVPALLDVADLLAPPALVDRIPRAVERLRDVGHSSGTALAWGLLRAAEDRAAHLEAA